MIEAGANEVDDDTMLEAIMKGYAEVQKMVDFIKEVQAEIGKPKFTFESQELDHDLFEAIKDYAIEECPMLPWIPMTRISVMSACAPFMEDACTPSLMRTIPSRAP